MNGMPSWRTVVKTWIRKILYLCPIKKDKVVFLNFMGKGYGDNPKYIANEIVRQGLPWKLIWLVKDEAFVPSYISSVDISGLRAFYELATTRFIVNNCKHNIPFNYITKKKKKQFYLQTWHGDFGPKYIEKEIEDTFSPNYLAVSKADSAVTDAILSGNVFFTKVLRESFWLPDNCKILEYGVPRNDIYFKGDEMKNSLKLKYGFSLEDKLLLYAPTFRDDFNVSCYNISFERLRKVLSQLNEQEWKVIIRLHPNISSNTEVYHYDGGIIDGSAFPDSQELCMISDCLITDYSSIMADFMLMKRPVFLYAPDLEEYADRTKGRGLRELYYHLPFPLSHNQKELERDIRQFNKEEYAVALDSFMREYYCTYDDGHASERVVNYLKSV